MTQREAFMNNELQLRNHFLSFNHKNKPFFSSTSILSRSPIAYNATAFLEKLTCTEYVDFGKCQCRFGQCFWFKKDSNCFDVKLQVFKKDDNNSIRLVQNLKNGRSRFQTVHAIGESAGDCSRNFW